MFNSFEYSVIAKLVGPERQRAASEAYQRRIALENQQSGSSNRAVQSIRKSVGLNVMRAGARLAGCSFQLEMSSQ